MGEYFPVGIMFLIVAAIGFIMISVGALIRPKKYEKIKYSVYECGMPEFTDARKRYNVRFYIIGLLFVIFDVETVFLFPWVVAFDKIGVTGLIAGNMFLLILVLGYFYDWRKGALEWD